MHALIIGLEGTALTDRERALLAAIRPCGIILFDRNLVAHEQIRCLVGDAKSAIGADVLVLIDQEGGRVQRLRPPLGRALPPAAAYARLYGDERETALQAARLQARLLADDLLALGINTDCAPVLDVPVPGAHDIIGDRAYGTDPEQVIALGRAVADGFLSGGVLPVMKHIPGHGRATADSHLALPTVTTSHAELSRTDFAPFRALSDLPLAMTAHVVFTAIDREYPASTSQRVTKEVIRGEIGFDGLLMSDDLSMKALSGTIRSRAEAVIAAGSDVALHCSGDLAELEEAAAGTPALAGAALGRFSRAMARIGHAKPFDIELAVANLQQVLAKHAATSESV